MTHRERKNVGIRTDRNLLKRDKVFNSLHKSFSQAACNMENWHREAKMTSASGVSVFVLGIWRLHVAFAVCERNYVFSASFHK